MKRRVLPLLTTLYGALGAILIILFAVMESLVSEALEARMGLLIWWALLSPEPRSR